MITSSNLKYKRPFLYCIMLPFDFSGSFIPCFCCYNGIKCRFWEVFIAKDLLNVHGVFHYFPADQWLRSMVLQPACLGSNFYSITCQLCELGHVAPWLSHFCKMLLVKKKKKKPWSRSDCCFQIFTPLPVKGLHSGGRTGIAQTGMVTTYMSTCIHVHVHFDVTHIGVM